MIECPDIPDFLQRRSSPPAEHTETADMARKRKAKDMESDETTTETTEAAAENGNGIGHNKPPELTDEQRQALFFQHKKAYEAALAAKKKSDADLKNVAKVAKAELGKGAVDDIKLAILLETDDGDAAFKERIEREMRVARWMGASAGTQFDMFDLSGVPAVDRAFDEGKRAGMEGKACSPPYDPSVPQHGSWIEGWQAGQSAIFSIRPPDDGGLLAGSEAGEGATAH